MIPTTLEAFRALMAEATRAIVNTHGEVCLVCDNCTCMESADQCDALATATPEQLLGIVGRVAPAMSYSDSRDERCFIVTPREGA